MHVVSSTQATNAASDLYRGDAAAGGEDAPWNAPPPARVSQQRPAAAAPPAGGYTSSLASKMATCATSALSSVAAGILESAGVEDDPYASKDTTL
mmetsp:Transcript_6368/g.18936  ORF Transcript_6368/g.18936 Transcript_6368/m.18936 type:complete len:95 (-) Transcript_6368:126-410(-)